ncbi:transporter substrate-binding domain-containing protein [Bradyrhizobium sp. 76]|uniref:transporter substrate-binding domain-containing protein n=1 Tax=Bradyrhizobium sp. 76 TaxID=2782680 RepID=UPI001FF961AE|nr:transporter substrate-binding domain-containing protein [Bradyrhizobium sp. 76]MCK1409429.1 transporter substrate-binding domain-containing protein [Bradyrhizobium sp. 76]
MGSTTRKLLVMLFTTAASSFAALAQSQDSLLASIKEAGQVKVALGAATPLVSTSPDGKATGYAVDLLDLVLKDWGLPPLTPVLTAWDAHVPALQARQLDAMGIASITELACKALAISAPYFVSHDVFFVRSGNPKHVTSISQMAQNPEIKLAVVTGSSQEVFAKARGVKSERIVHVPDVQAGAATVTSGRADAFQVGQLSVANPKQSGLDVVLDKELPVKGIGVAFRKQDMHSRDEFNEHLNKLRSNGVMKELYTGKYGLTDWDELAKLTKAGDLAPSCN